MISLLFIFEQILLITGFAVYDCSKTTSRRLFSAVDSPLCSANPPTILSNSEQVGTLLQIPQYREILAHYVKGTRETKVSWCSYYRSQVQKMKAQNFSPPSPLAISANKIRDWIKKGEISAHGLRVPLTYGNDIVMVDSKEIDDQGYCVGYSKDITYNVFKYSVRQALVKMHYNEKGEPSDFFLYEEKILVDPDKSTGILPDGTRIIWELPDISYAPWETLYNGSYWLAIDANKTRLALFPKINVGLVLKTKTHLWSHEVTETEDRFLYLSEGHSIKAPYLSGVASSRWSTLVRTSLQYQHTQLAIVVGNITDTIRKNQCIMEAALNRDIIYGAATDPDLTGFRLMGERGWSVEITGAAVAIVQCSLADAAIKELSYCTARVPILVGNSSVVKYMDPATRVIKATTKELACNDPLVPYFEIRGGWMKLTPHKQDMASPPPLPSKLRDSKHILFGSAVGIYPDEIVAAMDAGEYHREKMDRAMNVLTSLADSDPIQDDLIPWSDTSMIGQIGKLKWVATDWVCSYLLIVLLIGGYLLLFIKVLSLISRVQVLEMTTEVTSRNRFPNHSVVFNTRMGSRSGPTMADLLVQDD